MNNLNPMHPYVITKGTSKDFNIENILGIMPKYNSNDKFHTPNSIPSNQPMNGGQKCLGQTLVDLSLIHI